MFPKYMPPLRLHAKVGKGLPILTKRMGEASEQ